MNTDSQNSAPLLSLQPYAEHPFQPGDIDGDVHLGDLVGDPSALRVVPGAELEYPYPLFRNGLRISPVPIKRRRPFNLAAHLDGC